MLLAWSGVLAQRLARSERRRAQGRLKALLSPPAAQDTDFGPIPPVAAAIGSVAYREQMDHVWEMVNDLLSGDPVTFDAGGMGPASESGGVGDGGGGGGGESN